MDFLKKYGKWILVVLALVALSAGFSFLPLKEWAKGFTDWVQKFGPWGFVFFIGIYAVATVLFLPGWILTVSAGLVYGILGGTAVALSGATLGATLAFLVARYLVRGKVESHAKENERFKAIDEAIGKDGWKIIGLLRLSPLIPFNVSNYLYGITSIKLLPYVLASACGMLPGTLLYVYLGAAGKAGLGGQKSAHSPFQYALLGVGLAATIAVTVYVSHIAKKALKDAGAAKDSK